MRAEQRHRRRRRRRRLRMVEMMSSTDHTADFIEPSAHLKQNNLAYAYTYKLILNFEKELILRVFSS